VHAVLANVTIKDLDQARQMLKEQIVPRASGAPGFVAGYWTRSEDNRGVALIVFESEEAAQAVAEMIGQGPPNPDAVNLDSVEVREVIEHA
jgi:chemotaxis protein CheY-P-specific phosphatase CheC